MGECTTFKKGQNETENISHSTAFLIPCWPFSARHQQQPPESEVLSHAHTYKHTSVYCSESNLVHPVSLFFIIIIIISKMCYCNGRLSEERKDINNSGESRGMPIMQRRRAVPLGMLRRFLAATICSLAVTSLLLVHVHVPSSHSHSHSHHSYFNDKFPTVCLSSFILLSSSFICSYTTYPKKTFFFLLA